MYNNSYNLTEKELEARIDQLKRELVSLNEDKRKLHVRADWAKEALELHKDQLKRLGYNLSDSTCEILEHVIEQDKLQKLIDKTETELCHLYRIRELKY